ncbi:hypothetical protein GYA93_13300 [Gordonia desulfuricans]|uniref:TPR repeat domain-containing protein n=1 Tax=Gordonia desulfuricans TaxID=89051 RepID=A0A7K3LQQ4_9ACTN|nr:hypothetical protein [Gordonia desulfuricans]NDK90548.1 hypothetical protein [Gordonia desulfuricans]
MTGHTLTKAIMDEWRPWDLPRPELAALAKAIVENSTAAERCVDQIPATSWSGAARTAADTRAREQRMWAKAVAGRIQDLQTALTEAAEAISASKAVVNDALMTAAFQGFLPVGSNDPTWTMRYARRGTEPRTPARKAAEEREWTDFVKAKADDLAGTAAEHADRIRGAVHAVHTVAPPELTLSAQDGRRHALMAEGGWTPAEVAAIGRSLLAAGLTSMQIEKLRNGEQLTDVPLGVQQYLHMFYGNLGPAELFALHTAMTGLDDPSRHSWSSALGQGLLVLSNENVGTNTGFEYLPQWARTWAENRNSNESARVKTVDIPLMRLLRSTHGVPPGERLGVELIRKAAGGASRGADSGLMYTATIYTEDDLGPEIADRTYQFTISSLLEVGARNHEASAAFLSGHYADGTALPHFDRDQMTTWLYAHEWDDDGRTVGGLVGWIGDAAASGDPGQVALANRAFTGLLDHATTTTGGNTFDTLMNANPDRDAIGKINPLLADALLDATLPYLNVLAGSTAGGDTVPHLDPTLLDPSNGGHSYGTDEVQRRAARLFTLIASDNVDGVPQTRAGAELYRAVLQQIELNGAAAAHNPADARGLGDFSTNLRYLAQMGLYGAEYDLQLDENNRVDAQNETNLKVKNLMTSVSAGLTAVPHPVAIAAGAAGTAITPWVLSPETADDVPLSLGKGLIDGDSPVDNEILLTYGALAQILREDQIHGSGPLYHNGSLKSLDDLLSGTTSTRQNLLMDMETALREIVADDPDVNRKYIVDNLQAGVGTGGRNGSFHFDPNNPENYERLILRGPD